MLVNVSMIFLAQLLKSLNLNCDSQYLENVSEGLDPIERAIEKFKNHLSIKIIKETVPLNSDFTSDFESVNSERIAKLISELDPKKSDTFKGIPINVLKGSSDLCSSFLSEVWTEEIIHLKQFPIKLKLADVTPVFKKDDSISVKNYRPVSVLPVVSKFFERIMLNQINSYMDSFLSLHFCEYRKGFSTQTTLTSLIEKWKAVLSRKGFSAATLIKEGGGGGC